MVEPIKWKLVIVSPPLAIVLSVTALYIKILRPGPGLESGIVDSSTADMLINLTVTSAANANALAAFLIDSNKTLDARTTNKPVPHVNAYPRLLPRK
jgi:hypothetical protein